jgi:hypothetical protein
MMGNAIKKQFLQLARTEHGTVRFIEENLEPQIDAYWGSRKHWKNSLNDVNDMKHFTDWDHVIRLDHGYDETKPEESLSLSDIEGRRGSGVGNACRKQCGRGLAGKAEVPLRVRA